MDTDSESFDGSELLLLLTETRRELDAADDEHTWLVSRIVKTERSIADNQLDWAVIDDLRRSLVTTIAPPKQRQVVMRGFPKPSEAKPDRQLEASVRLLSWIENHSIDLYRWQTTDTSGRNNTPRQ